MALLRAIHGPTVLNVCDRERCEFRDETETVWK